ncbi:Rrf2 family transcriptional regulator [Alkalihalobacillus sp. LMS39]|uniref:Rrf2 family transcriptional regulator n=1 Tax=Alkalihalobacillus sp. LMS39 TaxID=2924032 RepID=UPI001FB44F97|nr:Rrf2 family transcriptional regulator [Alkalihalobacillus sp. LMS39]UOE95382.1 Rrf2 family transcriptional regulator [Alkalihalobacillus sp. LMS39]
MQLTTFTDYSLRLLLYLGTLQSNQLGNIKHIAKVYNISENHLSKIVHELSKLGMIETIRGRNGGMRLAHQPRQINIGFVVRQTEDLQIVECFDYDSNTCFISPVCQLKHVLSEALEAYLKVLDAYTLEDLLHNKETLYTLFHK